MASSKWEQTTIRRWTPRCSRPCPNDRGQTCCCRYSRSGSPQTILSLYDTNILNDRKAQNGSGRRDFQPRRRNHNGVIPTCFTCTSSSPRVASWVVMFDVSVRFFSQFCRTRSDISAPNYKFIAYFYSVFLSFLGVNSFRKFHSNRFTHKRLSKRTFDVRCWRIIFHQTFSRHSLQTLVFSKITPRQYKTMTSPDPNVPLPVVNSDPLCSNVYSVGERIVLAWLNHCYEEYRRRIWSDCKKGRVELFRSM